MRSPVRNKCAIKNLQVPEIAAQISTKRGTWLCSESTWFSPSVYPSVRLPVTPCWQCSCHRIIVKFLGVIAIDKSDVHAKGEGQGSKVKVTEVKTQFSRFRTATPVWIHKWRWNEAKTFMWHRRGAILFFKVIRQISRSHWTKNRRFWHKLGVSGLILQFELR